MRHSTIAIAAALAATFALSALGSQVKAEPAAPVAVELFTSQGCYSCPPAEAYLGELAARSDVIALEWHVDYWDNLVYGGAGKWKDPFSSPQATVRQRSYNQAIRGTGRVYTPQMIVGGARESVGSNRSAVENAIRRIRKAAPRTTLKLKRDGAEIIVEAPGLAATLWRVDFIKEVITRVRSGENKGKHLASHNIVRSKTRLGEAGAGAFRISAPSGDINCAIIAQRTENAPILAAAYCPEGPSS